MMSQGVDVCVVEDDPAQRALLLRRFLRSGFSAVQALNGVEGLETIRQRRPAVVICDVVMPTMSGIELCQQVRADPELVGTYFILMTAYASKERRREALRAGADDCLTKPYDSEELEARVRNGLRINRLQEQLRRAATTDGLTGLWNHSHFREVLDQEFARSRRYGGALSLLMIDLDHFKAINDTYGHETGNRVLIALAAHLNACVRDADTVARFGGEEFMVVCPETSIDEAVAVAERIRATLPEQVRLPELPDLVVRASLGAATSTSDEVRSPEDLVAAADTALYRAKSAGRNRTCRSDEADSVGPPVAPFEDIDYLRKQVVTLNMQAKDLCLQSLWALMQALEARDPYTARHSHHVRAFVEELAKLAGWNSLQVRAVAQAAMLHDIGKIGVPDQVLAKTTSLSSEEAALLRRVPLATCKILEPLRVFETETMIIRHLRERYDGMGYPDGLEGKSIPIGSRLLALAEAYEALTSDRAHRPSRIPDDALERIRADAGSHFDPEFVALLVEAVNERPEFWRQAALEAAPTGLARRMPH